MGCCSAKEFQEFHGSSADRQEFHDKYNIGHCIGKGAYGTVYLVSKKESVEDLAVKVVSVAPRDTDESPSVGTMKALQRVLAEKKLWNRAGHHPNILSLRDTFVDKHFAYFVMDRCRCTLLQAWKLEANLNEHVYATYFQGMAAALEHLHSRGVAHRDVKHDNFLISGKSGRNVKLCDFGLSAMVCDDKPLTAGCGSAPYMAPEMVIANSTHGTAADIWSFGVIVYMSFFGFWPYIPSEMTQSAMKKAIREGNTLPIFRAQEPLPQCGVSESAMRFVQSLLNRDPEKRPTATECLQMSYLADLKANAKQAQIQGSDENALGEMLQASIKAGAFSTRPAQPDQDKAIMLMKLQARSRMRSPADGKVKKEQKLSGIAPGSDYSKIADIDSVSL